MDIQIVSLIGYILLSSILLLQQQQFQWFWFSLLTWLFTGLLSAHIMPNILGITHWANLFPAHLYFFLGSIFFWLNQIERSPETPMHWQHKYNQSLSTLFALSLLVLHCAFLILALIVYWHYPNGLSVYTATFIVQLYLTNPLAWLIAQTSLMLIFYIHRHLAQQSATHFSIKQLEAGILLALIWLTALVIQTWNQLIN